MTAVENQLPERPQAVRFGAALFILNAVVLLMSWLFFPAETMSNGATVFFIMLWTAIGLSIYYGFGWVRYATALVLLAFVWGYFNAESRDGFLAEMTTAEIISKFIPLVALGLLWIPHVNAWFREVHRQRNPDEQSDD